MDPGVLQTSPIDSVAPFLTGGVVAAVAALSGTGFAVTFHSARRRRLWQSVGNNLKLRQSVGTMSMPALSGIYRGRALEATLLPSGLARISIRAANPRHLLDEIRADDAAAVSGAAWLNAPLRQDVAGLRDRWRRVGNIAIRGNFVTVNAPCAGTDSAHLRALLELAHRLAENVDSATGAFQTLALGPR